MPHAQQQILDAVKAALEAAALVGAGKVFLDRDDPVRPEELPAILIEEDPSGETVETQTIHGLLSRELRVNVSAFPSAGSGSPAAARELALKVEKVLAAPTATLATSLCKGGVRLVVSRQINSGDGERLMASRFQTWRLTYYARAHTPDAIP